MKEDTKTTCMPCEQNFERKVDELVKEGKALRPTALGEVTTRLMKEQFPEVVDVEFTANMEQQLDGVEHGKADWVETLDAF